MKNDERFLKVQEFFKQYNGFVSNLDLEESTCNFNIIYPSNTLIIFADFSDPDTIHFLIFWDKWKDTLGFEETRPKKFILEDLSKQSFAEFGEALEKCLKFYSSQQSFDTQVSESTIIATFRDRLDNYLVSQSFESNQKHTGYSLHIEERTTYIVDDRLLVIVPNFHVGYSITGELYIEVNVFWEKVPQCERQFRFVVGNKNQVKSCVQEVINEIEKRLK